MKKKTFNKLLTAMLATAFVCIAGGVGSFSYEVKADTTPASLNDVSFNMLNGASVRLPTPETPNAQSGLRFSAKIPMSDWKWLDDTYDAKNISFGTVIVPTSYDDSVPVNVDSLFGANAKYYWDGKDKTTETTLIMQMDSNAYPYTDEDTQETYMRVNGSIGPVRQQNYCQEFVGVCYMRIHTNNGVEYVCASENDNDRSIVYVAQRALEADTVKDSLTDEQSTYLSETYVSSAYKDGREYTYTIEHIGLDHDGNEVGVLKTQVGDKTLITKQVSAKEDTSIAHYTFDEARSAETMSGQIYANNRTTLKLYYKQDEVKVDLVNGYGCFITPEKKYVGKDYAVKADGTYNFTVTPPDGFDKHTQQIRALVTNPDKNSETELVALHANGNGTYALDLSKYEKDSTIKISAKVEAFAPTIVAGRVFEDTDYRDYAKVYAPNTENDNTTPYYKYTNETSGTEAGYHLNWGESGFFFGEVWYQGHNVTEQPNVFFHKGYKYVRFDMQFADNVTAYNIRFADHTYTTKMGGVINVPKDRVTAFNADGTPATTIQTGEWYTFYIQPTKGEILTLWTNGGQEGNPSVAYITNIQYLEDAPAHVFIYPDMVDLGNAPSLEYQIDTTDFAGSWKFTNTSNSNASQYGLVFDQLHNRNGSLNSAFFDNGYKYISLKFYVATDTVDSLILRHQDTEYQYVAGVAQTNEYFTLYDASGNKVNKWTVDEWYTLVIKPALHTNGDGLAGGAYINLNASTSNEEAPVMYVKDMSYLKQQPFTTKQAHVQLRTDMSGTTLTQMMDGTFSGSWKFTNDGTQTETQSGLIFDQINNSSGTRLSTFFDNGYKYISLKFYVETPTMDALILRHQDNIMEYRAGEAQTNDYFTIYDANGNKVNKWTAGAWYTLVIKPALHTNGDGLAGGVYINLKETDTAQDGVPVMYVKNVCYDVNYPNITKQATLQLKPATTEINTLVQVTEGEFSGSLEFVNNHLGRGNENVAYGDYGIQFAEVKDRSYLTDGYQYVRVDFFVVDNGACATLDLRQWNGTSNASSWIKRLAPNDTFTSEFFAIYDMDGNKVNTWTAGEWYTLVIKLDSSVQSDNDKLIQSDYLCIQSNGVKDGKAPVMYLKHATYSRENPYGEE